MRVVFISADGRLRSGWAIAVYVVSSGFAAAVLFAGSFIALERLGLGQPDLTELGDVRQIPLGLASLASALWGTVVASIAVRQSVRDAGFHGPVGSQLLAGFALGAILVTLASVIPMLVGESELSWPTEPAASLLGAGGVQLLVLAPGSAAEEVAMRGFVMQQLLRGTNRPIAVCATSVLFGVAHLGNPNASLVAAANITLVGIWFALLVLRSGSLWAAIGAHVAWNWFEGFVWGQPVSGLRPAASLFRRVASEGTFWTGGAFGPEAAGLTTVLLGAAILATLVVGRRPDGRANRA